MTCPVSKYCRGKRNKKEKDKHLNIGKRHWFRSNEAEQQVWCVLLCTSGVSDEKDRIDIFFLFNLSEQYVRFKK